MGWTCGELDGAFSSRAAIAFELGDEFADRVLDTARYGTVIYAAVRSNDGKEVFGLVLLAERTRGELCTKAISEDSGPAEDGCPAHILDQLTEPAKCAAAWRLRCRLRLARGRPSGGQTIVFVTPVEFTDHTKHCALTFVHGSSFRSQDGASYRIPTWWLHDYYVPATKSTPTSPSSTITAEERQQADQADAQGDYGSVASRIGRLGDARDTAAHALGQWRGRTGARSEDIQAREALLEAYDTQLTALRETAR